jgi:hypothetical protein
MTEKELDLLQFSAIHMAKFCAGSPEVVWSEVFQLHSLGAPSNDVPDDIFGDSFAPWRPVSAHGSKDSASGHFRRFSPSIDRLLDPSRLAEAQIALADCYLDLEDPKRARELADRARRP